MARSRGARDAWQITDDQWARIAALLPAQPSHAKGGRPRMSARQAMEGAFYVLLVGCKWKALPPKFGASSTVYGHFQAWRRAGIFHLLAAQDLLPVKDPNWLAPCDDGATELSDADTAPESARSWIWHDLSSDNQITREQSGLSHIVQ